MLVLSACTGVLSEPEQTWEPVERKNQSTTPIHVGDECAPACIWSSFAVSIEAQEAERDCSGAACACVRDGDVWTACEPSAPGYTGTEAADTQSFEQAGSSCGAGCVWSSFAVSMGAQPTEAQCDAGDCACVKDGDVWTACNADTETTSTPYEEPDTDDPYAAAYAASDYAESEAQAEAPYTPPPAAEPAASNNPNSYNATVGNRLADAAYREAMSRQTVGWCYAAVADAVERITGPFLWGSSAYMAADQLSNSSWFFEVSVSDLRQLPAGAVVVWGKGSSPHGHISVALGDGREASDHVTSQMLHHYGGAGARIFYPQ